MKKKILGTIEDDLPHLTYGLVQSIQKKYKKCIVTISSPPKTVKTAYSDEQPLVIVDYKGSKYNWWANWTSLNAIIDLYGEDENEFVGKTVELVVVTQPINKKMRSVIYIKGSFTTK